jgi:hypothetical protein
MILPSKHLTQDRALLTVGSYVLKRLDRPKTVSALWEELRLGDSSHSNMASHLTYDWFVLALDFLFAIGAIELNSGLVTRQSS